MGGVSGCRVRAPPAPLKVLLKSAKPLKFEALSVVPKKKKKLWKFQLGEQAAALENDNTYI